jgi:hypothetical protein
MATQFIVRSEGNTQGLHLTTVVYDGLKIGRLSEDGIPIIELPSNADIVIELVVKLNYSSAAESNPKPAPNSNKTCKASALTSDGQQVVDSMWNIHFAQLEAYKEQHGDYVVPESYDLSPELYNFVQEQRELHKLKSLHPMHKDKLDTLGFCFDHYEALWHEQYAKLIAFQAEPGHCRVPSNYKDSALSKWVNTQRLRYKGNGGKNIKESRIGLLKF